VGKKLQGGKEGGSQVLANVLFLPLKNKKGMGGGERKSGEGIQKEEKGEERGGLPVVSPSTPLTCLPELKGEGTRGKGRRNHHQRRKGQRGGRKRRKKKGEGNARFVHLSYSAGMRGGGG